MIRMPFIQAILVMLLSSPDPTAIVLYIELRQGKTDFPSACTNLGFNIDINGDKAQERYF
jgi:hypothetical protein